MLIMIIEKKNVYRNFFSIIFIINNYTKIQFSDINPNIINYTKNKFLKQQKYLVLILNKRIECIFISIEF